MTRPHRRRFSILRRDLGDWYSNRDGVDAGFGVDAGSPLQQLGPMSINYIVGAVIPCPLTESCCFRTVSTGIWQRYWALMGYSSTRFNH